MANNNCMLAVNTKTQEILASVELRLTMKDGIVGAVYLYGLDKTFKAYNYTHSDGYQRSRAPMEQAHDYLIRYWKTWVKEPWTRYLAIHHGGGSYWPRKVMGKRRWHKGSYSFEHGGTNDKHRQSSPGKQD